MRPTPRLPRPLRSPLLVVLSLMAGAPAQAQDVAATPLPSLLGHSGMLGPDWRMVGLPSRHREVPLTTFDPGQVDGQEGVRIGTDASYGTLVHALPGSVLPTLRLSWRWRLDQPLVGGTAAPDIMSRGGDDAALKVCAMFDHPLDRVPFVERQLLRVARSVSGEDLPAATLCYVWDSVHPAGLQGPNPYTQRVRFITLQGKGAPLAQWQSESRDVAADFAKLFADELPQGAAVPPVRAVLIGADSDNTGSRSVGWVGAMGWQP